MEIKFNIKKTSKNSLEDLLDIRKKNVKSEYWEELESQEESEVETKPKKTIRICFEEYQKIKAEPFSELGPYMNTIFFQFNYSPIINKLFPSLKKEKYERIESLNHSWRHYNCEVNACIHKTRSDTFSKKILQVIEKAGEQASPAFFLASFKCKYLKYQLSHNDKIFISCFWYFESIRSS